MTNIEYIAAISKADLSARQKLHAMTLALFADYETGRNAWPSIETLAERCGVSARTSRRALAELVDVGWLMREDRPGRTSLYHLTTPDKNDRGTPDKSDRGDKNDRGTPDKNDTPPRTKTTPDQTHYQTQETKPKNDDDAREREDVVTEDELEEVPDEYLGLGYWQVKRSLDRALALDGQGPIERGAWDTQVAPKLGQLEEDQREDYVLWCAAKIQAKGLGRHILIHALASDHAEWHGVRFREEALKANPNAVYHPGSNRAMLARRDFETGESAKYQEVL